MNDNWVYTKSRIISKDGVVLFDGDHRDADNFWDDNILLCKGSKMEAYNKVYTKDNYIYEDDNDYCPDLEEWVAD